jgi:hypothetical protein
MALRRQHRRKAGDDLVPISGDHVAAALEWKKLSVNGAAKTLGVRQQTLDTIVRGRTRRCYQSLREELGRLVDVPAAWLGAEVQLLPSLESWWADRQADRIFLTQLYGPTAWEPWIPPPRHQLAAQALGSSIIQAWKRDLEKDSKEAAAALARLADGKWKDRPWDRVMMHVTQILTADWWRRALLEPLPLIIVAGPVGLSDGERSAFKEGIDAQNERRWAEGWDAADKFAAHAAAAWTVVLAPWLTGDQGADYSALVGALIGAAGMGPQLVGSTTIS